jgi:hypothetical protein
VSVLRDPRISGEDRGRRSDSFTALLRAFWPRASSCAPAQFHRAQRKGDGPLAMNGQTRPRDREANRMATCARNCCRQLFAICGRCDRGRRYCSPECASTARREQLRRAGQQYQQSARGRSTHAMRQARYRARKADVTDQSGSEAAGASRGPPRLPSAVLPLARLAPRPPSCVRCGKSTAFMRTSLRIRGVPRSRKHRASFEKKSLVDHMRARAHSRRPLARARPALFTGELHRISAVPDAR